MSPMFQIKVTQEMGRGLYATKLIPAGTTVMQCELLVLSEFDTLVINRTELRHYTFVYNATQDCIVLGNGEMLNHSDIPNVSYMLTDFDGRKVMVFRALTDIPMGQQLLIDYGADLAVDTSKYIEQKSLMG